MNVIQKIAITLRKIPIAWLQLKYQRNNTFAGIVGILCITVLLFIQIGVKDAFLDSSVQIPASLDADILLSSNLSPSILRPIAFSSRYLYQALAVKNVASATPFYITSTLWHDQENARDRNRVNVFGISLTKPTLNVPGIAENREKLKAENSALFDITSRDEFTWIISQFKDRGEFTQEIQTGETEDKQRIKIVGLFKFGVSIAYDASFVTSEATFFKLFRRNPLKVDMGLIKVQPGSDIDRVVADLRKFLPKVISVNPRIKLVQSERRLQETSSSIGILLQFSLTTGILVGIYILYQILYSKISSNLGNYATLKAIGFSQSALNMIVLQQALIMGVTGYIPGALISAIGYKYLSETTKIILDMNLILSLNVLILVCLICTVSAGISIFKLREADPSDIFS